MREIVLDTETTGLDPSQGHRIVEIGCLELVDRVWTGGTWHRFIDPERAMPEDAFRIHGISDEMLAGQPKFADIADDFLEWAGDAPLVIHNAEFDMRFLNAELGWCNRPLLDRARAIDTLAIARRQFPGAPASLDALCKRFGVDNSGRELHGALIDAQLLAGVYYHLVAGRQEGLALGGAGQGGASRTERVFRAPRSFPVDADELAAHSAFVGTAVKNPIWLRE
ncbi:MAG: DNA polymerase III subunit epsilon [Pseudomonadota bacterium]|nr:DNA polymerase III subunit epsilon [Pseudomonadota bacterium]